MQESFVEVVEMRNTFVVYQHLAELIPSYMLEFDHFLFYIYLQPRNQSNSILYLEVGPKKMNGLMYLLRFFGIPNSISFILKKLLKCV